MQPAGITPEIGGIGTENPSFLMELKERPTIRVNEHSLYERTRYPSPERFLRHKYAGSDSVNVVLSSLQALLLLGPATGVDVDVIHVYLY
jgi:hypothetical protein